MDSIGVFSNVLAVAADRDTFLFEALSKLVHTLMNSSFSLLHAEVLDEFSCLRLFAFPENVEAVLVEQESSFGHGSPSILYLHELAHST